GDKVKARLALPPLLAAGCTVGPDYTPPPQKASAAWGVNVDMGAVDLARWWAVFQDPDLDRLVERAVAANHDLRIAGARIQEARGRYGVAAGALLPQIDASFSA